MTEKLKDLLYEQAATADLATPDLDTITSAGDRRVRRRRAGRLAGALAALAVIGGVGIVALGGSDGGPQAAVEPLPTNTLSWASGSTLYAGGTVADVGHRVAAYVRTDAGYVFTDGEGAVFSFVRGGVERVGTISSGERPRLVADSAGTLVGWVDPSGERPVFTVLDQGTGEVERYADRTRPGMGELADEEDPAYFYAIDDGTAYWRGSAGAEAVDLATGTVTPIAPDARNGFDLVDVEAGTLALLDDDEGVRVGPSLADARPLRRVMESNGSLSPDARYYAPDADALRLVEVAGGRDVPLRLPAPYFFATGYAWLGSDTLAVIAMRDEEAPISLLTCTVSSGECVVVTDDAGRADDLQVEIGVPIGG